VLALVLRRSVSGAGVLLAVAVLSYAPIRLLLPEEFPRETAVGGALTDLDRAFLHFDFGRACMFRGCPPIRDLWLRGYGADLWLLGGGLLLGIGAGLAGGVWCAARPRSAGGRALESAAMLAYCTPVYVAGLGLLLLFEPTFGLLHLPWFFEPNSYASPLQSPWDWFRSLLVPWLIVAAPTAAACLRLTLRTTLDSLGEDYVRTGLAKGLRPERVVRRHAAPASYPAVASLVAVSIPTVVANVVLVEWVFSVPGFFRHTKRAIGKTDPSTPDIAMLQALTVWAAVLIVVVGLVADLALARLDPRAR
jgi:peptide/nickel transport system permease protein